MERRRTLSLVQRGDVAAGEDEHSSKTTEHGTERVRSSPPIRSSMIQRSGSATIHADQSPDLSTC
jgi:hypothetical protein